MRIEHDMRSLTPTVTSRLPAKVIALHLGRIPERTVQNWQQGKSLPSAFHWEALKELFPELRERERAWAGEALGVDPSDDARLINEIQRLVMQLDVRRRAAAKRGGGS